MEGWGRELELEGQSNQSNQSHGTASAGIPENSLAASVEAPDVAQVLFLQLFHTQTKT